jgi:hypothetical protein
MARDAALPNMTSAEFVLVGTLLYGSLFQSRLARELEVQPRTLKRWQNGSVPIPGRLRRDLRRLCLNRAEALTELADQLAKGNTHV